VKNPLSSLFAKITPAPEKQVELFKMMGHALFGGTAVALAAIAAVSFLPPASLVMAAGVTALGLLGVGGMLLQEGENREYKIWMAKREKENASAPAPVVEPPSPAPVAEVKPAKEEFTAAAEKIPQSLRSIGMTKEGFQVTPTPLDCR